MKRRLPRLWWLTAAVAALVALSIWQWRSDHAGATLLDLDAGAVQRISVTWKDRPTRHYLRRDGHWHDAARPGARVDDSYLRHLAALADTPVLEWRDAATMDPVKLGLADPPVRVSLDGHELEWGALAAFGPQRFVRVGGRIAVVPASYSPRTPGDGDGDDASVSSQKS